MACDINAPQAQGIEYHNDLPIINAKLLILRAVHDPNNERCAASGAKKT
jgi:hypothetical protein